MPTHSRPAIAIIGLAGRFPDAPDMQAFWRNLEKGHESLSEFSDDELRASGIPEELLRNPNYVKKGTILQDADLFDASFFGFNPREAEIIDPQHRIFLECAWEALEDAGYGVESRRDSVGVFAGTTASQYVFSNLLRNPSVAQAAGSYQLMIGNDKDYLTTRVSYKLNLKGPSVTVQTACSTSLVAVQAACAALLAGQCDMALAGGVSLSVPQKAGYLYNEGMIFSPDGHCRPFDARGRGIRSGSGAGIIVLKRLAEAVRDCDPIRAVILGSAVNNDGGVKMGYTTPSVEGQAQVISDALAAAGVSADSIRYVEAHGTATPVGDPIEIAALSRVFRESTVDKQFCAIGSVKSNLGHLDAAAGIAGLIKTVLALEHKCLPPTLHFAEPNPQIDFENSPFFVNTSAKEWEQHDAPRRAGVSSFGIGGTNAHVVLEEAPLREESKTAWPAHLMVLSAKTASALDAATARVAGHLAANPDLSLADACYTTQVGRKRFPYRRVLVCSDRQEVLNSLSGAGARIPMTRFDETVSRPVAFMFSGQGSQHEGMTRALYNLQPVFRASLDECATRLNREMDSDIREILYSQGALSGLLHQTRYAQPALFAVEYSLARMWQSWGVHPESMIGHSIGEYVAACLAGVFTLEDGLRLVAARGRIMQQMPAGGMLAVRVSPAELQTLVNGNRDISFAAINAPAQCVISGPDGAIHAIRARLESGGIDCRPLHTSHAFHSGMMDAALAAYEKVLHSIEFSAPRIPFLSNLTGRWIRPEEATDITYWTRHLRETVRFADGMQELAADPDRVFLEVGPGQTLAGLARECKRYITGREAAADEILSSLPNRNDPKGEIPHVLQTVGQLWMRGVPIDWSGFHEGEALHRVSLPTYPFERQSYWVHPQSQAPEVPSAYVRPALDNWFYVPSWSRSVLPAVVTSTESYGPWLIFSDDRAWGNAFSKALAARGEPVVKVSAGASFRRMGDREYTIDSSSAEDYRHVLMEIGQRGLLPRAILYLWGLGDLPQVNGRAAFHSLRLLGRALGESALGGVVDCLVISSDMHAVNGRDTVDPWRSLMFGPCKVVAREYPHIRFRAIDVRSDDCSASTIQNLLREPGMPPLVRAVAYRDGYRWQQFFEPIRLPAGAPTGIREKGVYLITGGMGGIGLTLAAHLAETAKARLALISRTVLPERSAWPEWLRTHGDTNSISRKIRDLEKLEALGGEVLPVAADVCDPAAMREAIHQVHQHFGPIHGAIHAAGLVDPGLMLVKTEAAADRVLAPKVEGTLLLDSLLKDDPLDFLFLCSSYNAICGFAGDIDYSAANCFLDALTASRYGAGGYRVIAANWGPWRDVGMAHESEGGTNGPFTIAPEEGLETFRRVLASGLPQVAVVPRDLPRMLREYEMVLAMADERTDSRDSERAPAPADSLHVRPSLQNSYEPPQTETQRMIAEIWKELMGIRDIGIDDNFFELGGHSLLATGILARVRHHFAISLPLRAIFDAPTIRALSEHLDTLLWATSRPFVVSVAESEEREEIEL